MLFSINKQQVPQTESSAIPQCYQLVLKSACLTQRFQLVHLSNGRAVPVNWMLEGEERSLSLPQQREKRYDRMEGGDATCGSGCKEKLPCRRLWWANCSSQALLDVQPSSWVRRGADSPSYRLKSLDFTVCSWSVPSWLIHYCFPLAQSWEEVSGTKTWLDWWNFLQIWIYTQLIIKMYACNLSFSG